MIQQQQQVLPIGFGTTDIVNEQNDIVGSGHIGPTMGVQGSVTQSWILAGNYVTPPFATLTFCGATTQCASVAAWRASAEERLWGKGARYVEAHARNERFPLSKDGFRAQVSRRLHKHIGDEQIHWRSVLLIEIDGEVLGAVLVPEITYAAPEDAQLLSGGARGAVTSRAKEYWLTSARYTSPPARAFKLVAAEKWGGPAKDAPLLDHASYFDSLVALASDGAHHTVVDCTEFSAIQ